MGNSINFIFFLTLTFLLLLSTYGSINTSAQPIEETEKESSDSAHKDKEVAENIVQILNPFLNHIKKRAVEDPEFEIRHGERTLVALRFPNEDAKAVKTEGGGGDDPKTNFGAVLSQNFLIQSKVDNNAESQNRLKEQIKNQFTSLDALIEEIKKSDKVSYGQEKRHHVAVEMQSDSFATGNMSSTIYINVPNGISKVDLKNGEELERFYNMLQPSIVKLDSSVKTPEKKLKVESTLNKIRSFIGFVRVVHNQVHEQGKKKLTSSSDAQTQTMNTYVEGKDVKITIDSQSLQQPFNATGLWPHTETLAFRTLK